MADDGGLGRSAAVVTLGVVVAIALSFLLSKYVGGFLDVGEGPLSTSGNIEIFGGFFGHDRVIRGGSLIDAREVLRPSFRAAAPERRWSSIIGVRFARDL